MIQTIKKPKVIIKMSELINPHFRTMWNTKKPYVIARGGRGSFKSSTISLKLVTMMKWQTQLGHKANVVCIRENTVNLRDSVYSQVRWAIDMLHMTSDFIYSVSPMRITHISTGSSFYFYGGDKPEKLKSNTVQNVIATWFEEAANFKSAEVFDQTIPTFIRQKSPYVDQVKVFYSYNPPRNPYYWINEWIAQQAKDPECFIDTSTYLDDKLGITTDQQLKLIETYKHNDPDYYNWLYMGKVIGLGTNVYNMNLFHSLTQLPVDDPLVNIAFTVDAGHINSATTCLCVGLTAKGNTILLHTYYYSPEHQAIKKAPSDLVPEINGFEKRMADLYHVRVLKRTIDSAEGALRNEFIKEYSERWHGVAKSDEATMIDYVSSLLAQGRVYYLDTDDNQIFVKQHQQYQWDEKTVHSDEPRVVKENDHTVDAFKYFAIDNARELGLKQGKAVPKAKPSYIH